MALSKPFYNCYIATEDYSRNNYSDDENDDINNHKSAFCVPFRQTQSEPLRVTFRQTQSEPLRVPLRQIQSEPLRVPLRQTQSVHKPFYNCYIATEDYSRDSYSDDENDNINDHKIPLCEPFQQTQSEPLRITFQQTQSEPLRVSFQQIQSEPSNNSSPYCCIFSVGDTHNLVKESTNQSIIKFYSKYCQNEEHRNFFFESLYAFLEKYKLTPAQLLETGFPLESFVPGKAYYKSISTEDYHNSTDKRICARCYTYYSLLSEDNEVSCVFHPLRAAYINSENNFSRSHYLLHQCCNAEKGSIGCISNNYHVSSLKCQRNDDFVTTTSNYFSEKNIFSLDTEMCYTKNGLEVTKVSVLTIDGELLYETYIKPDSSIIDYNTKFSGITAELLENVTTRLEDVQESLLDIINTDTILIGHGLENDLKALHFIHTKIVDTSILYPDPRGPDFRPSLRYLSKTFLGKVIQENTHNSKEDAKVCLELVLRKWHQFFERQHAF